RSYDRARGKERTGLAAWAAEARYYQGELVYRDFEALTLAVAPAKLDSALAKKAAMLEKASTIYFSIADYKDVKWATAGMFRAGQVFDGFAESLIAAPTPADLPEADAQ